MLKNVDTMAAISQGLDDNPGYRLILSGHSLGAGIAALMGIKLNFDAHPLAKHGLQCFGFGCPPVFGMSMNSPTMQGMVGFQRLKKAIANTVCFINGEDIVPLLSIDSIRRLADMLEKVDEITETLNPLDRLLMARGIKEPPEELVAIVKDGSAELAPLPGTARLKIPARFVVWMGDAAANDEDTTSDVVLCKPSKVANLSIHLADEFMFDHLPPRYEERFEDLFGTAK